MVSITPILKNTLKYTSKIIGPITSLKGYNNLATKFAKDPDKMLGTIIVMSIIAKDGVGCWKYVTQSLHNDKIPEKKRKFVAALDLTNGGLMIVAQIAMFLAMRKYSGPLFDKLFKKSFNPKTQNIIMNKIRMIQNVICEPVSRKLNLVKTYNEKYKDGLGVFKFVLDTAAATIVGKRVIVPFIATPLASKVEKWMNKKAGETPEQAEKKEAETKTQEQNTIDILSKPSDTTNILEQYRKSLNK